MTPDGACSAGGKALGAMPLDEWIQIEMIFEVGKGAARTWTLRLTPQRQPVRTFELPFASKGFAALTWLGFSSPGEGRAAFYVDAIELAPLD